MFYNLLGVAPSLMPATSAGCFTARLFIAKKFFRISIKTGYPPFVVRVYASHTPIHQLYICRYPFGGSRFILRLSASGVLYYPLQFSISLTTFTPRIVFLYRCVYG